MESIYGRDFSSVRVHDDSRAARSAAAVNALAYTVGHDVVFAPGWDKGATAAGRRLLAHELAHVLQQEGSAPAGGAATAGLQRQVGPATGDCKGWESDRESMVTAVARHYAQTALDPPVIDLIRTVEFSRDGLIGVAKFEGGLELFVSLHFIPHYIPVVTHGSSNVRGPRCEFEYSCRPDGSIVFTTRVCDRQPGNPAPPTGGAGNT